MFDGLEILPSGDGNTTVVFDIAGYNVINWDYGIVVRVNDTQWPCVEKRERLL